MNEVIRAIMDRRSTRGFTDEALTEGEVQTLVDAALAAPTARNTQYWHFSVVHNQALLDEMNDEMTRIITAKKPEGQRGRFDERGYHVFYHAPTVIFISIPEACDSRFAEIDAGIAVENIALAAQGLGLGSVIVGMIADVFEGERAAEFNARIGVPEGWRFAIAVVVGHNSVTKGPHPIGENKVNRVP